MKFYKNKILRSIAASSVALLFTGAASAVTWKAGDTDVTLYGYVKLDMIYDFDADLGNSVTRSKIRLDGQEGADGHFNMHAYQSRFGFITLTPTENGDLKTLLEIDFFGSPGTPDTSSQILRLRRAFAEWNGILAGQNSSNFGPETAYMPTLDFYGQPGGPNGRVPQIRYTAGPLSFSLEDPEIAGGTSASQTYKTAAGGTEKTGVSVSNLPTLTAAYNNKVGNLTYVASALVRQLQYNVDIKNSNNPLQPDVVDSKKSATGWGLLLQGAYVMGDTTLRAGVTHGDGIGKAIYFNSGDPAYYNATKNKLETVTATGFKTSLSQKIGNGSANIGYSRVMNQVDDKTQAMNAVQTMDKTQESLYVNYLWNPIKRVTYGVEVSHHKRKTFTDVKGDATRLQASLQYMF